MPPPAPVASDGAPGAPPSGPSGHASCLSPVAPRARLLGRRAALLGFASLAGCARDAGTAAAAPEPAQDGAPAGTVSWRGEPAQGGLLIGHAPPGTRLTLDGRPVRVGADGSFVFGFGRDAVPEAVLVIRPPRGAAETRRLAVAPRQWQEQHLSGLPGRMVTPNAAELERIRAEQAKLNALRRTDSPEAWFAAGFDWPARGRISGVYGSRRILNGQPRAPHLGLDVAVPVGTPIQASATGRVLLAEDLYFTGNTVILDHGHGVGTLHAHLSRMDCAVGQRLERGETLGLSGATGRVTGPHLHFAMNWFGTAVDPRPLLPG
nr:M23 family metallopeptidase [Roseomonas acroporae]